MEGVLLKWTNYWNDLVNKDINNALFGQGFLALVGATKSRGQYAMKSESVGYNVMARTGWQTRWFILQDGILSYYRSAEEIHQGCKGSMKVSALEITVSNVDNTRMDLSIPGEKNLYLRAPSSQERQLWLIALGSSKACVTNGRRKESVSEASPEALKSKKNELRLYCDLLMQQVHLVKTAANQESGPDVEKITEGSSLLSVTCDTFIKTLEDCMKLSISTISSHEKAQMNEKEINNISKPTIPVRRVNSTEKKA